MKTYCIEIRMELDEEKEASMLDVMREHAKQIYARAMILSNGRKPQVALHCTDFFEGAKELDLDGVGFATKGVNESEEA